MPLSGSRTEFLAADALGPAGDIQYGRSGGWFVTTKKAFLMAISVILAIVVVAVLVHYMDSCKKDKGGRAAGTSPESASTPPTSSVTPAPDATSTAAPASSTVAPPPEVNYRLPKMVVPRHYNIWMQPFIGEESSNFTFKGRVSILVNCLEESGCSGISLHAKDLDVDFGRIKVSEGETNENASRSKRETTQLYNGEFSQDKEKEMLTLTMKPSLVLGKNYSLDIPFTGNLTKGLAGFYRSSYVDGGVKRWLATTHFEATHARKAFPCFDEPAMKAKFELHIARPANMTSVANLPIKLTEAVAEQSGWMWDHYPPSPIMSTYLVAFMVSELALVNASSTGEGDPTIGVVARRELLPQAQYSLDIGPRILKHYTDYFSIPYPLPKLDMAAIPDFAAGAMENWGLVTYRESRLLYNPNSSTTGNLQSVAVVVAHELAHQWFGNLVTMEWWADLWLNEGFATYVSYIGVNHVEPTWEMLDRIVTQQLHPVLDTDSLLSTHPISVPVNNPGQISEAFDDVSYNKGACLIRMLNHSITEPVFRAGLTDYLNKWRYANAKQDDLWAALTAAAKNSSDLLPAGKTVKDVMDTWTLLEGYPVVIVTRDYTNGSMLLTQRRFRLDHASEDSPFPNKQFPHWYIPISFTNKDEMKVWETRSRVWMSEADLWVQNVTKPGSDSWVLLNLQQTGYYRVHYDNTNWRLLTTHLQTSPVDSLPSTTRAQLINDALSLARGGLMDYGMALNLTRYLPGRELNLIPWVAFFDSINFVDSMLRDSRAYGDLQDFIIDQANPILKTLGQTPGENDTQPQKLLRTVVIGKLLKAEHPQLVEWAQKLFQQWMNTSDPDSVNPIPVDFRGDVYCAAIRAGGNREWRWMLARFEAADSSPGEAQTLLRSLMCTRITWLVTSLLERSLEEGGGIRLQDSITVWRSAAKNPVASAVTFGYMRRKWHDIYKKYSKIGFVQKAVLKGSTAGLSTSQDLDDLVAFKEAHSGQFNLTTRTVEQCIERLRLKVLWQRKYYNVVSDWLKSYRN